MKLSEHFWLVECERNSVCFQYDATSLVDICAKQLLSLDSNIASTEVLIRVSKVFLKEMAHLASKKRVSKWTVPSGAVPVHINQFTVMCRRMRRCSKSEGSSVYRNGLSCAGALSTELMCTRFRHLPPYHRESRKRSKAIFILILARLLFCWVLENGEVVRL